MAYLQTDAIVLHHSDWRDYDRMVTLFSPRYGKIDAVARGCRRPKSALVNAVQPFTSGTFSLFEGKERYTIDRCEIKQSFYELRMDYDRLTHGVYWLKLLDFALQPEEAAPELFLTTLHALAHLCYADLPLPLMTMAFEMHFMSKLGMAPRMDCCMACGRPIDGDARFDPRAGGVVCLQCPSAAPRISNGARRIVMKCPRTAYEKVPLLRDHPNWQEAARLYRLYMEEKMPMGRFTPAVEEEG